jgi:hypothetical protein
LPQARGPGEALDMAGEMLEERLGVEPVRGQRLDENGFGLAHPIVTRNGW